MKIFFYDLETTGTNYLEHGIHQISGVIVIDGVFRGKFDFHVAPNPKKEIDVKALDVAKVTREQVEKYRSMKEAYDKIIEMLGVYVDKYDRTDKFFLAGYNNASFDDNFFREWFRQNGDEYFGSWFWGNSLDVMVLASQYFAEERYKMEDFKLSTVAKKCGVKPRKESLHNAMYDIYLTTEVYKKVTNSSFICNKDEIVNHSTGF